MDEILNNRLLEISSILYEVLDVLKSIDRSLALHIIEVKGSLSEESKQELSKIVSSYKRGFGFSMLGSVDNTPIEVKVKEDES